MAKKWRAKYQMGGYVPTDQERSTEAAVNAGVGVVGAINPIVGAGLAIGQGVGKMTVDENGLYKSRSAEFIDNNMNPTTGVQDLVDVFKDPNAGAIVNKLSAGLFGKSNKTRRREEALKQQRLATLDFNKQQQINNSTRILDDYDMLGVQGGNNVYALGGKLKQLNSDTVEVEGRTHAEGGVKIPGAEVEDDETIAGDFVFSDVLGFADRHKTIAKQIGAVEKKPLNKERRTTLEILRKKENALMKEQEAVKGYMFPQSQATDLTTGAGYTEPIKQMGGPIAGRDPLEDYLFQQTQSLPAQLNSQALREDVSARVAQPTSVVPAGQKFNWQGAITSAVPFITNIANIGRRSPKPALPNLEAPVTADYVNFDADRNDLSMQLRGANNGLNAITNNGGTANAVRATNFASYLEARNKLAQNEQNANTEIRNRTNILNQQVDARNSGRKDDYNNSLLARNIADQRFQDANLADFTNKLQMQQRDKSMMRLEDRKIDSLLKMYQDTGVVDRNLLENMNNAKYFKSMGGKIAWRATK